MPCGASGTWTFAIEIDGGMTKDNVGEVVRAGCDWIVTGSSIFHTARPRGGLCGSYARRPCRLMLSAVRAPKPPRGRQAVRNCYPKLKRKEEQGHNDVFTHF